MMGKRYAAIRPVNGGKLAQHRSRVERRKVRLMRQRKIRLYCLLTAICLAVIAIFLIQGKSFIRFNELDKKIIEESRDKGMLDDEWQLRLVNSNNPLDKDFTVKLKTVQYNHKVDERIADYLTNMIEDAKNDGVSLLICSSYRSVARQQELFNEEVNKYVSAGKSEDEALAEAAYGVAVPGYSEHSTGLAIDIVTPEYQVLDSGFENTDAFKWLDKNAHKYGFVLRYPKDKTDITRIKYEPWHYRFVGLEHAREMKDAGVCLEEYLSLKKVGVHK